MQLNGTIYLGDNDLSVREFIHEYGHYLQEAEMGLVAYMAYVGGESVDKAIFPDWLIELWYGDSSYYGTGYEQDASYRGNEYMNTYYPETYYKAPTY